MSTFRPPGDRREPGEHSGARSTFRPPQNAPLDTNKHTIDASRDRTLMVSVYVSGTPGGTLGNCGSSSAGPAPPRWPCRGDRPPSTFGRVASGAPSTPVAVVIVRLR